MKRHICIHGHFYQPPRENPWLDAVEMQDSASPYHDWNKRITAECYAPNTAARILGSDTKIIDILNNYTKISFNFGPTLLYWMEKNEPEVYKSIIQGDKESKTKFSGHGSAIAQCYNHMIMPLANEMDKRTQIIWGLKDFEYRFERKPEGMWLPETAVDLKTLEIMAEFGILFAILAPHQAKSVRKIGSKNWKDVSGSKIDPKMPYLCNLPSGKKIALFFYDGGTSQSIAFGNLLNNGEEFANRLNGLFDNALDETQLVHVAVDGETFGHHHYFGDMALAYCLHYFESNKLANITIYAEYLEKYPPTFEVEIFENSSWSCAHGIERWRSNCGCNSGMNHGWAQDWRAPLRGALDWLRDTLVNFYEENSREILRDPWEARNDYIEVIIDRSDGSINSFLSKHSLRELSGKEKIKVINLLEMQRFAMFMYTSCGWFFDEVSGIETVQIIQYAVRAIQLAKEIGKLDLEEAFANLLERVPTNIQEFKNGGHIYELFVKPALVDFLRLGAHYAVSSLFKEYEQTAKIYCYYARTEEYEKLENGKQKLALGKMLLRSEINGEEALVSFAVLHLGDHNFISGVREFQGNKEYGDMKKDLKEVFSRSDFAEAMRLLGKHFGSRSYSLWHLFKDEQRQIVKEIYSANLGVMESTARQIMENNYPLVNMMKELRIPYPNLFKSMIAFLINTDIHRLLEQEEIDFNELIKIADESVKWGIELDKKELGYKLAQKVDIQMESFFKKPDDVNLLERIKNTLAVLDIIPLELNLWKSQNALFSISKKMYDEMLKKKEQEETASKWIDYFTTVSEHMKIKTI
ncbi:MAG: DUF3536 domain-containing protein [bacterium]